MAGWDACHNVISFVFVFHLYLYLNKWQAGMPVIMSFVFFVFVFHLYLYLYLIFMYLSFGNCLKIFESRDKWEAWMPVIMSNETDTSVLLRAFTKNTISFQNHL